MPVPIPDEPFARVPGSAYAPAARRSLRLFGAPVELVLIPERAHRPGVPTKASAALRPAHAERILAEETVWRGGGCALTPNRYPFAERQLVLWAEAPVREPDREMLELGLRLAEANDAAMVVNSVGAAASIPRAHLHLLGERLPFLEQLPLRPVEVRCLAPAGVAVRALAAPFPALGFALAGPLPARAASLARLLELRSACAFNAVSQGGTTWWFPRSTVETPAPHFPHALGGAELWGRWCYASSEAFAAATAADLERALALAGVPADARIED